MYQASVQQIPAERLSRLAESADQALCGNLHGRTFLHPFSDLVDALSEQSIPLRMRDYRNQSYIAEARENLLGVFEDQQVGELHQQIVFSIDRILASVSDRILDVFVAEMQVATGMEPQSAFTKVG